MSVLSNSTLTPWSSSNCSYTHTSKCQYSEMSCVLVEVCLDLLVIVPVNAVLTAACNTPSAPGVERHRNSDRDKKKQRKVLFSSVSKSLAG